MKFMELKKYSRKEANKIIKQRFSDFMKAEGFIKRKGVTGHFFRVKEHFIQYILLDISSSIPEFECQLFPAYLYENGYSRYAKQYLYVLEERLPKEHRKISFTRISDNYGKYPIDQFDEVWENYKYLIKELAISYLDGMDFDKTIELFQNGKDEMFRIKRGTYFDINAVEFTLAGAFLIRGNYTEGFKKLKAIRDFYFEKAEEYKSNDIWLFSTKADYIDKLLKILENKSENWENKLQNEIAEAERITFRMFGLKV